MNPNDRTNWGSELNDNPNDGLTKPDWNTDEPNSEKPPKWNFNQDPRLQQSSPSQRSALPDDWAQRLTDADKRVIKECNSEAFYKRGLPLAAITVGINSFYSAKKNVPFTSVPLILRNILLAGLSFAVGKMLYAPECIKKIEALNEETSFLKQKLLESNYNKTNRMTPSINNAPVQKVQTPLRPYETTPPKSRSPFEQKFPPSTDRFSHLPDFRTEKFRNTEEKPPSPDIKFKFDDDKPFRPYADDEYKPRSF